ncbi:hypothetical protein K9N68_10210 [Kovacikia minuta CCNUW1]|uniref:hypothetical protein n=1 Tax=Kovacikia minuta TaxID=2931930 RepID=UPI001CCC2BA2|nr:hypothetical protein [Kovacikia minuta]UBF28215.1 hypothetical protein K9N68_10210 [Kovacikia minuta CCNUW1]
MNWVAKVAVASLIFGIGSPAIAQTCSPLRVVGAVGKTSITKKVSQPGIPGAPDNWNTDFATNSRASRYVANVRAKNEGNYKIAVYLKYPNNTADKVFENEVPLKNNQLFTVSGSPRANQTPYQVNVFVGGTLVVGNTYTAAASACY